MNESQPHASNIKNTSISRTVNDSGFNFEKYDPYLDILRTLFVPNVDKRICELLELLHTNNPIDSPSYWERCLNIVSTIKYQVGVVQSYLKQAFCYFVSNGLINFVLNTLVLSNRLDKVCRDLDSLGEKNIQRYTNAWNFVNEKSYWRVSNQSASITAEGPKKSLPEAEAGSTSSSHPTSISYSTSSPIKSDQKYRKSSQRSSKRASKSNSENSSCSCTSIPPHCGEKGSNFDNDKEKKLKVLIGDPQNSKYSEIRKSSVPCKCENLIKHFIKTDLVNLTSKEAKKKLEEALKSTCFSLNQILEPMDSNSVQKCQLLCKLKENYVKIKLKKQEACLFMERIDITKKDSSVLRNRSELEKISEEIPKKKNSIHSDSKAVKNNSESINNDSISMRKNSVAEKSFDLNESDLRGSKVDVLTSTKIYNTGIPKKRNKCLDRRNCGNFRGDLCKCDGMCFCDLDSFDDDFISARASTKSWGSSIKCDSENNCTCSSGSSGSSEKKCCGNDEEKKCCSKGSSIDIYININGNKTDKTSIKSESMKSISVQTIEENLEQRPEKKSGESICQVTSSIFEALKTIAEENCDCNEEKIEACDEKPLIDFGDSFESESEDSCDCDENNSKELSRHESINRIAEGFVKSMVEKIEGNNLVGLEKTEDCVSSIEEPSNEVLAHETARCSSEEVKIEKKDSIKDENDCNCSSCSVSSQDQETERKESGFDNKNHDIDCNCSECSGSVKEIKGERKESSLEDKEDECDCISCSGSSEKLKEETKEETFENDTPENECICDTCSAENILEKQELISDDIKHETDCRCSVCSVSVQEMKLEMRKSLKEERIEENLQEDELGDDSTCSIGSFQDEIYEFIERKSEEEVVDEIKAPAKSQIEDDEEIADCGCTLIDSEDIFTSAQSVLQKSAVEIELSKDRGSLSPIVEFENREVEAVEVENREVEAVELKSEVESVKLKSEVESVELKPKILSRGSLKVKDLKTEEEKSNLEESEKVILEKKFESKVLSSESSAPETRRSVVSKASKISSLSPAEANCGSSSFHRSHFSLHNYTFNCHCSEIGRSSKPVPRRLKNYHTIPAERLQHRESRAQKNVHPIISALCCQFRYIDPIKTLQKLKYFICVKINRLLKKRDKATSTSDLPRYSHYNRKNISKFSMGSDEYSEGKIYCPEHKKNQNYNRRNSYKDSGVSSKQDKEAFNHFRCHCNAQKNSQFQKSNCGCNNYKKNLSETSYSSSQVNYLGRNGSGDSENSHNFKKGIAVKYLTDFLEAELRQREKLFYKYQKKCCNYCRDSWGEEIKLLRMSKSLNDWTG